MYDHDNNGEKDGSYIRRAVRELNESHRRYAVASLLDILA